MSPSLARHLGFWALVIYGIGDILGAGIYALVGKVVAVAGEAGWISFVFAAFLAVVTGLSYAELSARFPVAAGAAAFIKRAFKNRLIATLSGVLVLGTGLSSAATVTTAFSGYLAQLIPFPPFISQIFFVLALSFLSFWGIRESSRVNVVLTAIEVSGLLAVITAGVGLITGESIVPFFANSFRADIAPVLSGATIAFFAYIGFEDLCNLAEEAKNPSRDLPRAVLAAIAVTSVIYLAVTIILQMTVPHASIAFSNVPLLLIFEKAGYTWVSDWFALVAMLAIANTGLANLIMASRLLYGMAQEGLLHPVAGRVHAVRQTPWVGILFTAAVTLTLVLTGGLKTLAQTTSLLIVVVFLLVHASLIRVKFQKEPHAGFKIPLFFPFLGSLLCLVLLVQYPIEAYLRSWVILLAGFAVWFLGKRKG